jgi:hypothetical protein
MSGLPPPELRLLTSAQPAPIAIRYSGGTNAAVGLSSGDFKKSA